MSDNAIAMERLLVRALHYADNEHHDAAAACGSVATASGIAALYEVLSALVEQLKAQGQLPGSVGFEYGVRWDDGDGQGPHVMRAGTDRIAADKFAAQLYDRRGATGSPPPENPIQIVARQVTDWH